MLGEVQGRLTVRFDEARDRTRPDGVVRREISDSELDRASLVRRLLARQHHGAEDPPPPAGLRRLGEQWLDHAVQGADELGELGVVEPQAGEVVAGAVADRVESSRSM